MLCQVVIRLSLVAHHWNIATSLWVSRINNLFFSVTKAKNFDCNQLKPQPSVFAATKKLSQYYWIKIKSNQKQVEGLSIWRLTPFDKIATILLKPEFVCNYLLVRFLNYTQFNSPPWTFFFCETEAKALSHVLRIICIFLFDVRSMLKMSNWFDISLAELIYFAMSTIWLKIFFRL